VSAWYVAAEVEVGAKEPRRRSAGTHAVLSSISDHRGMSRWPRYPGHCEQGRRATTDRWCLPHARRLSSPSPGGTLEVTWPHVDHSEVSTHMPV